MQMQDLNQHHGGELLSDRKAAWQRLAQLPPHPLGALARHRLVRFAADMHDERQQVRQDAGMIADRGEMLAGAEEPPPPS
jgi:hypothetical protein